MRVFYGIFAVFVGLSSGSSLLAADASCSKALSGRSTYPNTRVKVQEIKTSITYNQQMDRRSLTAYASGEISVEPGSKLNGLTVANMTSSVSGQFSILRNSDGSYCVWPARVDVQVGYPSIEVHIAKEFRRGTCQYSVTMEHEQKHVHINQSALRSHMPRIRGAVARRITLKYPMKTPPGVNPSDHAVKDLSSFLENYVNDMSRERDARHSHLDSPESYRYWKSLCPSW